MSKALNKPNKDIISLKSKLASIDSALKLDPTNVDLLSQKQRLLGKEVDSVKDKLKVLKTAQEQFIESGKDVDSDEYIELQKQVFQTEDSLKKLKKEQVNVNTVFQSSTIEMAKALNKPNKEIDSLKSKLSTVNAALKLDPTNIDLLSQKQRLLGKEVDSVKDKLKVLKTAQDQFVTSGKDVDSDEYIELQKQIAETENSLKSLKKEQVNVSAEFQSFAGKASEAGKAIEDYGNKSKKASLVSAAALTVSAKSAIDWETAWTGVLKTVDGTPEQLEKIKQGIMDIATATGTSKNDIAKVAENAGQLGVATDNVLAFTETMVMLGDTTNLSADEASSALAKFANVTKMSANQYGNLGSSIVALGNNFATTEADIVAMATRLAATGELAGLSESGILGISTALSSLGIEAEAGGSGFSKLLKDITLATELGGERLNEFAGVAGQSASEFKQSFETDAAGAVATFISGLSNTERNGKSAIAVLDEMGITEVRMSNAILSMANNSDILNNALSTSSTAWGENTAIQDEASKRYATVERQMLSLKESFSEFAIAIGEALMPIIKGLIDVLRSVSEWLNSLSPEIQGLVAMFLLVVAALAPMLILIGKLATGIEAVGVAFKFLSANPIILIVAAIVALVAAFAYLWSTSEGFRQFWYDLWDGIAAFFSKCWNSIITFFTVTIPQVWEKFKTNLGVLGTNIKRIFSDAWNNVISFFTQTIPAWIASVGEWFNKIPYNIGLMVGHIIGHFIKWGLDLKNFVTKDIPNFINTVVKWFASLPGVIWQWLCDVFNKIKEWGLNIIQEGNKRAEDFVNTVVKFFSELPGKLWSWLCETANKVIVWGVDLCSKGRQAAGDLVNTIVNTITSLPGQMLCIGKNLVQGIWNGILSAKDWIMGKIGEFTDGIVDGIKDFFGIASPSRIMRDQVGKFIAEGIGVGIEKNEKSALSPLGSLVKKATDLANSVNIGGTFDYSGVQNKLNNELSLNSEFMNSAVIQLNANFKSELDGRTIANSNTSYTTNAQMANLAFKGGYY